MGEKGVTMFKLKSPENVTVVSEDSYTKVICTSFGNIALGSGLLFPTSLCLSSQAVYKGASVLGSNYVSCYTQGWKTRNICRAGRRYELNDMAPMQKRMDPEDIVYFEVWRDDADWNQY